MFILAKIRKKTGKASENNVYLSKNNFTHCPHFAIFPTYRYSVAYPPYTFLFLKTLGSNVK